MSVRRKERVMKQLGIFGENLVNAQIAIMTAIARDDKLNDHTLQKMTDIEVGLTDMRATSDSLIQHYHKAIEAETAATQAKKG